MTLYKVYWKEKGKPKHGIWLSEGTWFVEIPDRYGRKKAAMAREEFYRVHGRENYEIIRVVKEA